MSDIKTALGLPWNMPWPTKPEGESVKVSYIGTLGYTHTTETKKLMAKRRRAWYKRHPDFVDPKKGRKTVTVTREQAQQLYDTGKSYKQVAQHFGVSVNTIQRLDIKTRSKSVATQMWWDERKAA